MTNVKVQYLTVTDPKGVKTLHHSRRSLLQFFIAQLRQGYLNTGFIEIYVVNAESRLVEQFNIYDAQDWNYFVKRSARYQDIPGAPAADRSVRWTPEELDYLKVLYKLKPDYSLHRLADIASKNLGRPAAAIEAKLEHLTADGEIWK
jgi:hypothetical protein